MIYRIAGFFARFKFLRIKFKVRLAKILGWKFIFSSE